LTVNKLIVSVALGAALVAGAAFMPRPANALTIDWTLSGVTFDDGGTATGTFATDGGLLTSFNLTTTPGSALPGTVYNNSTAFIDTGFLSPSDFGVILNSNPFDELYLLFASPLTTAGTNIIIGPNNTSFGGVSTESGFRLERFTSGGEAVATTPIPNVGLPGLIFVGLGAFLAWRRSKRNASSALAAA
jgi:hypothetical protein